MGVIYKLLPEVSSFIVEQKKDDPKATCKNLAGRVFLKFGQQVSKSSVHELLKRTGVITTRVRKSKDKFQIPVEKKAQLSKAMQPFIKIEEPIIEVQTQKTTAVIKEEIKQTSLKKTDVYRGAGEIFLKAALWDLSFKPILGITDISDLSMVESSNLKLEWEYLTQLVYAIKFESINGESFYLDGRFQGVYAQNPRNEQLTASIERAAAEVADHILNNVQAMVIRGVDPNTPKEIISRLVGAFENMENSVIQKISLLGIRDQVFAEYSWPEGQKRQFILKIPHNYKEFQWVMEGGHFKIIKEGSDIFLTNLLSRSQEEIAGKYHETFPGEHHLRSVGYNLKEPIINPSLWIRNRLKERALMFFSTGFSLDDLDQVLSLNGFEAFDEKSLEVQLQASTTIKHTQNLQEAVESINNLFINDFNARKLKISIY